MNQNQENILRSASAELLTELRKEGQENLKSIFDSENAITSKANTLLQVLVPIFVAIFAYLITTYTSNEQSKNYALLLAGTVQMIIIGISCANLFDTISAKRVSFLGFQPSNLADNDILEEDDDPQKRYLNFVIVYSLEHGIVDTLKAYDERAKSYQRGVKILLNGTATLAVLALVLLWSHYLFVGK